VQKPNLIAFNSPIGIIRVFESNGKVTAIDIAAKGAKATSNDSPVLQTAKTELEQYFAGKLTKFTFPVDLSAGTEFQRNVWRQIGRINFGKTKSYADIAKAIGKPKAARAVGGAVGSNPVPLVIGCHRVMGASGKITGYSGGKGIPTKEWLLEHEGIPSK
jgi:methylated-DNA-[protein]-cysteine S-methyltransferase